MPSSHFYISQRLRLHYVDWGNEGAPLLLLVHGIRDHCRSWDWLAEALMDEFHVVAPDLRGHGDSAWAVGSSYGLLDYAYDIAQLLRQMPDERLAIAGHSLGGTIATLFGGVFPERLTHLVSLEGIGLWPGMYGRHQAEPTAHLRAWVEGVHGQSSRVPRRYATLEEAYGRMQKTNPHLSPEQARHLTVHGANRNEDGSYTWKFDNYNHVRPAYDVAMDDLVRTWGAISCPVLLLTADGGFPHRIGHPPTLEQFADAEHRVVEGAGHWVHHDQLEACLEHISGFLTR